MYTYGWKPSVPDIRDYQFMFASKQSVPDEVDLTCGFPIEDQGNLGSCTAFGSTRAYQYLLKKEGLPDLNIAKLSQYFWTRELEHTTMSDSGGTCRDAVKVLAKVGGVPTNMYPYDESKFDIAPPPDIRKAAKQHVALKYGSLPVTAYALENTLALGYAVIIGFSVYSSIKEAEKTGVVPFPSHTDTFEGGHCVCLVGYSRKTRSFKFDNSWTDLWGDKGQGYLPYGYVRSDLMNDFRVLYVAN